MTSLPERLRSTANTYDGVVVAGTGAIIRFVELSREAASALEKAESEANEMRAHFDSCQDCFECYGESGGKDDKLWDEQHNWRLYKQASFALEQTQKKLEVAREALGWYSHKKCVAYHTSMGPARVVVQDNGERARDALKQIDGDGTA